jgi:hypothetical protein
MGAPTIDAIWKKIDQYTGGTYHDDATLAIVTAVKTPSNVMPIRRPRFTEIPRLPWNQIGSTGLTAGARSSP